MTWAQILPQLRPGVKVICQNNRGVYYPDRLALGERIGPDFIHLGTGTFSMATGLHVCGERRIIGLANPPTKKPEDKPPGMDLARRERLIRDLVRARPPVLTRPKT